MYVYLSAIDLASSTGMTRIKRPPGAMVNDKIVLGMEAMTCMECFNGKVTWIRTGRLHQDLSWKNLNIKNSQFFCFTPLLLLPLLLPLRHILLLLLRLLLLQHLPHLQEYQGLLPFCQDVLQTIWEV